MKSFFLALALSIFLGGCSTLRVEVDHIPDYDFSTISTFAVVYTNKNDGKDFTRNRISSHLNKYMQNKGYKSVDKNKADFYITLHLDTQKRSEIETNYETLGIRPLIYPFMDRMYIYEPDVRVTTTTNEYEYRILTLEVFDVKKNSVVWQGIAKYEKSTELTEVVEELFKDFPSK